jgi:hypothetical protein
MLEPVVKDPAVCAAATTVRGGWTSSVFATAKNEQRHLA